jgi:hypothetical protein
MLTTICKDDLEFVCKTVRDLVEDEKNANQTALKEITTQSVEDIVIVNDEQYQALSKDQLRDALLSAIADCYDFSEEVKDGLKKSKKSSLRKLHG